MEKKEYTAEDIFRIVNRPGCGYIYTRERRYGLSFHYLYRMGGRHYYKGFGRGWSYEEVYNEISRIIRNIIKKKFKLEHVVAAPVRKRASNFDAVFEWFMTSHEDLFSRAKLRLLRHAGRKFSEYLRFKRKASAPMNTFDHAFIEQYQNWLQKQGMTQSSVSALRRRLRIIFAAAVRVGRISNFPF